MKIRHSDYGDDLFFVGYNGNIDDAAIEQKLIADDVEKWEIVERREAHAADTNTSKDLEAFSRMWDEYDSVDLVRTRSSR